MITLEEDQNLKWPLSTHRLESELKMFGLGGGVRVMLFVHVTKGHDSQIKQVYLLTASSQIREIFDVFYLVGILLVRFPRLLLVLLKAWY